MIPALRWAAMRTILMFHNCEGRSHKTVSTDHNFWRERRAEADSNRGPSAYQPNSLPLGQTGSPRQLWETCVFKLQVLVYDILPSTTAVFSYAIGFRKLSANKQFFVGAQTVVSLLQTTQIKQDVSFIAANKVYTSTNKTTIVWIETELSSSSFLTRGGCVSCLRARFGARLLLQSYQYPNLSEGADCVGGLLRGNKECPFSGVTKSGRVWRKVPESDARSVLCPLSWPWTAWGPTGQHHRSPRGCQLTAKERLPHNSFVNTMIIMGEL